MELYIEKDFLDNFYMDYQDGPIQEKVKTILSDYGSKTVFMDITVESQSDLEKLKSENPFFASLCGNDKVPVSVNSIEEHVFTKSNFEQTIIFMNEEQEWFKDAENKGAICFGFNGYKSGIKKIIDNLHFRIDLSEGFDGWNFLKKFDNINYNIITITDGYILSGKDNKRINSDIINILRSFSNKHSVGVKIIILTKELNPLTYAEEHKKEKAKKRFNLLNRELPNNHVDFSIVLYDINNDYDFHDRTILTNFSIIDCGKGFRLEHSKKSNSQIISETIFDKYTYNRLRRNIDMQNSYINKLKSLKTNRFKMYPTPD